MWGLDIKALSDPGEWKFTFDVTGELVLPVREQPGPPMGLSWAISTVPLFGLVALMVISWRRTREDTSV